MILWQTEIRSSNQLSDFKFFHESVMELLLNQKIKKRLLSWFWLMQNDKLRIGKTWSTNGIQIQTEWIILTIKGGNSIVEKHPNINIATELILLCQTTYMDVLKIAYIKQTYNSPEDIILAWTYFIRLKQSVIV